MNLALRLLLLLCLLAGPAEAEVVPVPPLSARVTDLTGTLDAAQKAALEEKLARFEKHRGSQIAVLIVPSTRPETIEQYSIRVADEWKIGRKPHDDGVILLVAKDDHKLRMEVGYGLEGALPDAICRRIIAEDIAPRLKAGDWAGGLDAGVERMEALISGEHLPPPVTSETGTGVKSWENMLLPAIFAVIFLGRMLRAILGRLVGGLATGALAGFGLLLVSGSLILAIVAGFLVFLFSLMSAGRGGWYGGWGGGWGGGGAGGWGGGGSGGWSGGGGGFGGGGASGDW